MLADYIIYGPYAVEKLLSPDRDKIMYLFYDYHYGKSECDGNTINVFSFLDDLFKESRDYVIDFMLEVGPNQNIPKENDWLELVKMWQLFKDCYSIDKNKCPYNNVRIHWTDVRTKGLLKEFNDMLSILQSYGKNPEELASNVGEITSNLEEKFMNVLMAIDGKFTTIDILMEESKIMKQIDNIVDRDTRDHALKEIKNRIIKSYEYFQHMLYRRAIVDHHLFRSLLEFTSSFLDGYTVSRILRNFGEKSMTNIIMYTGGAHAKNISDILQDIGYESEIYLGTQTYDIKDEPDKDLQCLNITTILPLF